MYRIVVDESFMQQMPGATAPCLVFNRAGKRLGYFMPEIDPALYQGVEPSVDEEELQRRERAGGGRTLSEIIADLEQRQ